MSRKTSRDTMGSLAAGVAGQLALLISGTLAARLLGPTDRGHLAFLIILPIILAKLGSLGLSLGVTYECARTPERAASLIRPLRRRYVQQSAVLVAVHALLLLVLLRDESATVQLAGALTLALIPAILAHEYSLAFLQGLQQFKGFNILRTLPSAVYTISVVLFFAVGLSQLDVFVMAWVGAWIGVALLTLRAARAAIPPAPAGAAPVAFGLIEKFGAKSFLGSASPVETFRVDQALIGLFLPPIALGYYVAALAFTNLPRLLAQSIGMVANPAVASRTTAPEGRRTMWRFFWLSVLVCTPVVALLELTVGWLLPALFGGDFDDAVPMSRVLLAGAYFLSLRRVLTDGARGLGRPVIGTVAEVSSWVVLLPAVGVAAAAGDAIAMAYAVSAAALLSFLVILVGLVVDLDWLERAVQRIRIQWVDRRRLRSGTLALIACVLLVDVASAALFLLPGTVGLGIATAAGGALAIVALRSEYARQRSTWIRTTVPEGAADAPDLRWSRWVYYAGTATVGFLVLRPGGDFTVSDLLYLVAVAAVIGHFIATVGDPPVLLPRFALIGVGLFCVGGLFTAFYEGSATANLSVLARVAYLVVVWFWLGTIVLTRWEHIRIAMAWWVASAGLASAAAIVQFTLGDVIPGASIHYGRVSGLTDHVNDLGGLAGCTLVPALALLHHGLRASRAERGVALVSLPLIATGLVLSGSISGITAAMVSGAIWVVATRTVIRGVALLALVLLVTSAIAASGANSDFRSPLQRFTMSTAESGSENATFWTRVDTYEAAWREIVAHPLYGVGLRPEDAPTVTGHQVHNNLMKPLFEGGAVAALGMALIYLVIAVAAWQTVVRARSPDEHLLSVALTASYVAYFTWGLSQPALFKRFGWMSGALVIALWAQQVRAVRRLEAAEAAEAFAPRRLMPSRQAPGLGLGR